MAVSVPYPLCYDEDIMSKKNLQFGVAILAVVTVLGWLAYGGVRDSKTYYVTVKELKAAKDDNFGRRLRVGGNVAPGTIKRDGKRVEFTLIEEGNTIPVVYTGSAPLPDTFVPGSLALADGKLNKDGIFEANQIQAKCASKYEAKPGQAKPGQSSPAQAKPASSI
jgi:cytochrome c-type biogenesis protein CcmE